MSQASLAENSPQQTHANYTGEERRVGAIDRRAFGPDRRNEDRIAEDLLPRRNPDQPDRRITNR